MDEKFRQSLKDLENFKTQADTDEVDDLSGLIYIIECELDLTVEQPNEYLDDMTKLQFLEYVNRHKQWYKKWTGKDYKYKQPYGVIK